MNTESSTSESRNAKAHPLLMILATATDPTLTVDASVYRRVKKYAENLVDSAAQINFLIWAIIWIATIFLNDWNKPNRAGWIQYRITVIALLIVSGIVYSFLKNRGSKLKYISLFMLPIIVCVPYSWAFSMGLPMIDALVLEDILLTSQ